MPVNKVSGGSYVSSILGNRNMISGLASGMDTESMIEKMVMGTKGRIDRQKQLQTKVLWRQQAYRGISDKLVALSTKYTSYASASSNLMSANFFKPSIVTSIGKYKDMISASGNTDSKVVIDKVTQLAQDESITFEGLGGVTTDNFVGGGKEVDLKNDTIDTSNIAGGRLSFEYGNKSFAITLDSNKEYKTVEDVAKEINKQLEDAVISIDGGNTIQMKEKLEAKVIGDKLELSFKDTNETNKLEIKSGSSTGLLNALHLEVGNSMSKGTTIQSKEDIKSTDLVTSTAVKSLFDNAEMKFKFNGNSFTLRFPSKDSQEYRDIFDAADPAKALTEFLQNKLNNEFGHGRITVTNEASNGKFNPKFTAEGNGVFSIEGASAGLLGKEGVFGIEVGASNRVNVKASLGDIYGTTEVDQNGEKIKTIKGMDPIRENGKIKTDGDGNALYAFEINGVKIGEYSAKTDIDTIMNEVNNNKEAHVRMSYSAASNQFVMTSTHGGAGGRVAINQSAKDGTSNLAAHLFGEVKYADATNANVTIQRRDATGQFGTNNGNATHVQGQDAKLTATVNGAVTEYTSGTNTFDIDGLKVTANGTFTAAAGEAGVSFNAKVDSDKVVDAVKDFVKDYNELLDELHGLISTQPDRSKRGGFEPLTDDQKADMSEKQIEEYEKKAKKGLMFSDNDLNSLSNDLRFIFSDPEMAKLGITVSSSYTEKGKISLDEKKLRDALESDPDAVAKAFADPISTTTDANGYKSVTGGAITKLKVQLDKYAGTTGATKGILIERAGSQFAPLSLMNNALQRQMDSYDTIIDSLNEKLNREIDTYTHKFSQLEVLIGQMNSQSAALAGLTGGGMGF